MSNSTQKSTLTTGVDARLELKQLASDYRAAVKAACEHDNLPLPTKTGASLNLRPNNPFLPDLRRLDKEIARVNAVIADADAALQNAKDAKDAPKETPKPPRTRAAKAAPKPAHDPMAGVGEVIDLQTGQAVAAMENKAAAALAKKEAALKKAEEEAAAKAARKEQAAAPRYVVNLTRDNQTTEIGKFRAYNGPGSACRAVAKQAAELRKTLKLKGNEDSGYTLFDGAGAQVGQLGIYDIQTGALVTRIHDNYLAKHGEEIAARKALREAKESAKAAFATFLSTPSAAARLLLNAALQRYADSVASAETPETAEDRAA